MIDEGQRLVIRTLTPIDRLAPTVLDDDAMKIIACAAILANTAPAFAQAPGALAPAPIAQPAPQRESLGAGNGPRVRRFNITSNPIAWPMIILGLSVQYAVEERVALRLDGNLFAMEIETGHEYGATVQVFVRRAYSGPFLEAGVLTRNMQEEWDPCHLEPAECMEPISTGPQLMIGYAGIADNGLNVAIAIGAMHNWNAWSDERANRFEPVGYFRVGYAL